MLLDNRSRPPDQLTPAQCLAGSGSRCGIVPALTKVIPTGVSTGQSEATSAPRACLPGPEMTQARRTSAIDLKEHGFLTSARSSHRIHAIGIKSCMYPHSMHAPLRGASIEREAFHATSQHAPFDRVQALPYNATRRCLQRAYRGSVPKWPTGADCKSAGLRLRWFESSPAHHRTVNNRRV